MMNQIRLIQKEKGLKKLKKGEFKPGDLVKIMMYDMDPSEIGVFVGEIAKNDDEDEFHSGEVWVYICGYAQPFWFDEVYGIDIA